MKDYYKILEVSKNSSQEEIKQKYRELAKKWHPDANGNSRESEERFKDIAEAYSVLSSPVKRKEYDDECIFRNSYTSKNQRTYEQASWQSEEEAPFYTFYYTYNTDNNKKTHRKSGSFLKGVFQIIVGVILFLFPGYFQLLGLYALFSGVMNIGRSLKQLF